MTAMTAPPTTPTEQIDDVVVTTSDASGSMVTETVPCADGKLELHAPVGSHNYRIEAMGTFGDVADATTTNGTMPQAGAIITLPAIHLTPEPPVVEIGAIVDTSNWCGMYVPTNVLVEVMSAGRVYKNFSDCYSPFVDVKNVPYGPLTVTAKLQTKSGNTVVKTTPATTLPPTRGYSSVELTFPN